MTHWTRNATCATLPGFNAEDYAAARPICAACPVKAECLADAMEQEVSFASAPQNTRWGIRGGLNPRERQRLAKPPATCTDCGVVIGGRRRFCDGCLKARKRETMRRANAKRAA